MGLLQIPLANQQELVDKNIFFKNLKIYAQSHHRLIEKKKVLKTVNENIFKFQYYNKFKEKNNKSIDFLKNNDNFNNNSFLVNLLNQLEITEKNNNNNNNYNNNNESFYSIPWIDENIHPYTGFYFYFFLLLFYFFLYLILMRK
jgi:hypothetical protein